VINSPLENHSSSTLSMSFGNSDFQKALGIDIKHLIDKGFNNNGNNHDDSSGKNINIKKTKKKFLMWEKKLISLKEKLRNLKKNHKKQFCFKGTKMMKLSIFSKNCIPVNY